MDCPCSDADCCKTLVDIHLTASLGTAGPRIAIPDGNKDGSLKTTVLIFFSRHPWFARRELNYY